MADAITLETLDITDTALYAERGYPWREWDLLRREAPVYWYERPDYEPFWAITRYEDVLEISRRSDVFVNSGRLRLATIAEDAAMLRGLRQRAERFGWDPHEPPDFVFMDDPRHRRFRLVTSRWFTPAALRALEPRLAELARQYADELVAKLRGEGPCDLVAEFSVKLPLATICEMMGLPAEHWERIVRMTNALLGVPDPEFERPGEDRIHAMQRATGAFRRYFEEVVAQRRAEGAGGDDLASVLLRAEVEGEPLTAQQLLGYLQLLVAAGNETTRNATTGGVQALLEHPEECARLCAHPELVNTAVEEILRWTSPVIQFARTADQDFELRGKTIRKGESVGMFYPSANRDEEAFPAPYRFDVARSPNHHLAFGGFGAHFCLGANLARWELRAALRALLPVLPHLALAGPPERIPHLHVGIIQRLPVRGDGLQFFSCT